MYADSAGRWRKRAGYKYLELSIHYLQGIPAVCGAGMLTHLFNLFVFDDQFIFLIGRISEVFPGTIAEFNGHITNHSYKICPKLVLILWFKR